MNIDKTANAIVKVILADVTDRRGWRQEWDQFDDGIKREIKETWTAEVKRILRKRQEGGVRS